MKCTTVIDKDREEEVVIYLHEKNSISDEIERLVSLRDNILIGYMPDGITPISPSEVFCFITEESRVIALVGNERLRIKARLCSLEEVLGADFVKINQSCIVNIKKIKKFGASIGGALLVELKNGYKDYVSRRQLKAVKERMGI